MNTRTKTALNILQIALGLGILGDVLLRQTPWGLNVLLFNAAFITGMVLLLRRHKPEFLTGQTYALFGAQLFFAAMFVWRDSIELRLADSAAILAILSALFLPRMKVARQLAGVVHYAIAFLWSSLNALFAPFAVLSSDIEWSEVSNSGWSRHLFSVLRGVAIVTPVLLIFGALFVAADAAYEGWMQRVFNIMPETVLTHVLLFSIFAWLSAGYLRGVIVTKAEEAVETKVKNTATDATADASKVDQVRAESGEHPVTLPDNLTILEHINKSDPPDKTDEKPKPEQKKWNWATLDNTVMPTSFTLGPIEVGVILGLMNLLFLSFVIVQVPYLFGGMDLVQNTPDFKLAEYARRGFGELVAVSALVLPILLASHWLVRKDNPFTEKLFRVLAGIQIGLLFVIMASAVQRLILLTGNLGYGMTTIRLYPMIFMIWLAIVFVWFGLTVLRGARQYFAWGALWSAFFVIGATHVLNPDEFIVQKNLKLMQQGREFDAYYNSSLSDDAIPALIEGLPNMTLEDRCEIGSAIHYRYRELGQLTDLRSLNFSRRTAWWILRANDALLHQTEGCPDQYKNDKPSNDLGG